MVCAWIAEALKRTSKASKTVACFVFPWNNMVTLLTKRQLYNTPKFVRQSLFADGGVLSREILMDRFSPGLKISRHGQTLGRKKKSARREYIYFWNWAWKVGVRLKTLTDGAVGDSPNQLAPF